jgi:2,3,4,5-tetrahydropyridine-2-carboxylate N-succinyltransferase
MSAEDLQQIIEAAWETREEVSPDSGGALRDAVEAALAGLDAGAYRVAEKRDGAWQVNQWLKKAVLLSFRLNDVAPIPGGPGEDTPWWDKVPSKFAGWGENRFRAAGFRAVPNCIVRHSAHIAPGWSIPGPRSGPAPRSARTATFPAVPASAGCWNRSRPAR